MKRHEKFLELLKDPDRLFKELIGRTLSKDTEAVLCCIKKDHGRRSGFVRTLERYSEALTEGGTERKHNAGHSPLFDSLVESMGGSALAPSIFAKELRGFIKQTGNFAKMVESMEHYRPYLITDALARPRGHWEAVLTAVKGLKEALANEAAEQDKRKGDPHFKFDRLTAQQDLFICSYLAIHDTKSAPKDVAALAKMTHEIALAIHDLAGGKCETRWGERTRDTWLRKAIEALQADT